jgi:hypothetical protein
MGTGKGALAASTSGVEKRCEKRVLIKFLLRIKHRDGRQEASTIENYSQSGVRFVSTLKHPPTGRPKQTG